MHELSRSIGTFGWFITNNYVGKLMFDLNFSKQRYKIIGIYKFGFRPILNYFVALYQAIIINMANSYAQIHLQFVFAVKYRASLIDTSWKERLHQYMTGIFQENRHKLLQINSMPDHIHILIGMRPDQSISSLIQNVKTGSNKWIKENKLCKQPFAWQEGYGAFSYGKSQVPDVIKYIQNQEAHHRKETFLEEYRRFLKVFEIEWDEQYIFKELE